VDQAAQEPAPTVDLVAVVGAIGSARADIYARVAEVNSLTEKEVMNAASRLGEVVESASRNRDEIHRIVEMFDGGNAQGGLALSLGRLTSTVEEHVTLLVTSAKTQETAAQRAQASTKGLIKASREIEGLLQAAKLLALNARIEANRASVGDRAFTVVADEIKNLSEVIAKTNSMVQDLATNLAKTLTALADRSVETRLGAEAFAKSSRSTLETVREEASAFQTQAHRAVASSEAGMAEILRASHGALSSLQFQDVVAQGLLRIDQRLHDLQVDVARQTGQTDILADVAPSSHVEVGGDKAIKQAGAGDINLF
jgi:hypothetical protein